MERDLELLNSAREWNKDALAEIFDLYASAIYNYVLRLGNDPIMADDVVGDVFSNLFEQLFAGKGPKTNLRSYLYQTAYHMIIDRVYSSRRNAPVEIMDLFRDDLYAASIRFEDQAMVDVILQAIRNELTEDQRHVVILRFLEEFSLNETAAILGKEVSHIKVIQNRALAKLRKNLGD